MSACPAVGGFAERRHNEGQRREIPQPNELRVVSNGRCRVVRRDELVVAPAPAGDARRLQDLWPRSRADQRGPHTPEWGGPRTARRERRRQVDIDEGSVRHRSTRCGRNRDRYAWGRSDREPPPCAVAWHRTCEPGTQPRSTTRCDAEYFSRPDGR